LPKHLLSARRVATADARDKGYRLHDGGGLALWVAPSGAKSWQLRYKLDGKDQTATLGKYAGGKVSMSLAEARAVADEKLRLAEAGEHLTEVKRLDKATKRAERANTFEVVARDWVAREARRQRWSPAYVAEVEASIRNHLDALAKLPVAKITAQTLSPVLRAVEARAPMMLEKVRPRLDAILDYAVEHGVIAGNPLPAVRRQRRKERRHYPAVTDLAGVGDILRAARAADPCRGIQRAHVLLAFTALRVSEVVGARWDEFELDGVNIATGGGRYHRDAGAGNWAVPRERMKRKDAERGPHVVPLAPHLLAALRDWRKDDGRDAAYVCPAPRDPAKSIVPEAIEKHYRNALSLAGKHSPHSWRSAFKSICSDAGKPSEVVEAQLDHVVGNAVAAAYDRATRLELRRELLTWYEATLIAARDGAPVVPIKRRRV
jgi:integrase